MSNHLQSKTIAGLMGLLGVVVVLAFTGHLNEAATEAIKWIGGAYMGVRMVANGTENMGKK